MHTDVAWNRWGEEDPYFAVLTEERYRTSGIDGCMNSFFESGRRHVDMLMEKVAPHLGDTVRDRALDFGCGVGRLAIPLSTHFHSVAGIDISTAMLREAASNAARQRCDNIELAETLDALPSRRDGYALVNSYIVLQHIPTKRGMAIIRHLLRLVKPGGVASIHVCVSDRSGAVEKVLKRLRRYLPGMRQAVNACKARPLSEPPMEMNAYDIASVLQLMADDGFDGPRVDLERHGKFLTANLIARRAPLSAGQTALH